MYRNERDNPNQPTRTQSSRTRALRVVCARCSNPPHHHFDKTRVLNMKQKIQILLNQLNHGLVEREATLRTVLLTVLARENIVLIGPPGTGKSLIARRIADSFTHENANGYFEYLLTKFSTPEEIFGPLSISELKADRFKRNTAGYLPTVQIAFLDEIFKASSSILNALLTILNERVYHNGAEVQKVPLQSLIAASNELPSDQAELSALYDRFLVRGFVDYVSQNNLRHLFEQTEASPITAQLTVADLDHIQHAAQSITIPLDIQQAIQSIWIKHQETFKEDRRESLSDRRLKKIIKLLCVSAATNEREQVDLSDVFLLKDCLWNHPDNAEKVRALVLKTLQTFSRQVPQIQGTDSKMITNDEVSRARHAPTTDKTVGAALSRETPKTGKLHAKEKGYKGQGTKEDPILIGNVQDLMGLDRIGAKGYAFRQTADLDCNEITTWPDIKLEGHYDGNGYWIQYQQVNGRNHSLFKSIHASSVKNLDLRNLRLAPDVSDSHIDACVTNCSAIGNATNSAITTCEAGGHLIWGDAANCKITASLSDDCLIAGMVLACTIDACASHSVLIGGRAVNSTISDCCVHINKSVEGYLGNGIAGVPWSNKISKLTSYLPHCIGGIANTLSDQTTVKRCFVTGEVKLDTAQQKFSGIACGIADGSIILQCAIGRIKLSGASWDGRIVANAGNPTLEHNISIDSNGKYNDKKNGESIAAARFNQRYFEHTLGWDFDTVWKWDDEENHPVLQSVGVDATASSEKSTVPQADTTDLLTQQISDNIWL